MVVEEREKVCVGGGGGKKWKGEGNEVSHANIISCILCSPFLSTTILLQCSPGLTLKRRSVHRQNILKHMTNRRKQSLG